MDALVRFVYENGLSELQCCEVTCFHILGHNLWSTLLEFRDVSMVGILVNGY